MRFSFVIVFLFVVSLSGFGQVKKYNLITRNTGKDTMWDGNIIRVYGFTQKLSENTQLPSATLYANEGDTLELYVRNISQGDPHTVHPHGMDADQANDGTPMTSFSIAHMEEATYRIYCSHAGTYIYHCHVGDVAHVQAGMYGLVVVRPKDGSKRAWTNGPAYDKEYAWLMSEVDKAWHDSVPQNPNHDDSLAHEDFVLPTYIPDYFLVHGLSKQQIKGRLDVQGKKGEKIYIRLANIGFYLNEVVFPASAKATWIDSDGRPLPSAVQNDTLRIAPGERYGVMIQAETEFTDSIAVRFINMNTMEAWQTEYVPMGIKGNIGFDEINISAPVTIYPNPASSYLTIESEFLTPGKPLSILIINTLGQKVYAQDLFSGGNKTSINLPRMAPGVYQVTVTGNNNLFRQKVFISQE